MAYAWHTVYTYMYTCTPIRSIVHFVADQRYVKKENNGVNSRVSIIFILIRFQGLPEVTSSPIHSVFHVPHFFSH